MISTKDNVLGIRGNKDIVVDINGGELSALDGRTGIYVSSYDENAITINFKGGKLIHNGGISGAI